MSSLLFFWNDGCGFSLGVCIEKDILVMLKTIVRVLYFMVLACMFVNEIIWVFGIDKKSWIGFQRIEYVLFSCLDLME